MRGVSSFLWNGKNLLKVRTRGSLRAELGIEEGEGDKERVLEGMENRSCSKGITRDERGNREKIRYLVVFVVVALN